MSKQATILFRAYLAKKFAKDTGLNVDDLYSSEKVSLKYINWLELNFEECYYDWGEAETKLYEAEEKVREYESN